MTKSHLHQRKARVLLIALFSKDYPMVSESHGISVLAGCLEKELRGELDALQVIDLYALDCGQKDEKLLQVVSDFQPTVIGISVPYGSYSYLREFLLPFGGQTTLRNLLNLYEPKFG